MNKGAEAAAKVASCLVNIRAPEGNLANIRKYFQTFCEIEGISSDISVYQRKVFIGTMIRLYNPQVYDMPSECISVNFGFVKKLGECLGMDGSNVSKMIRQVVFEEKMYEDFAEQIKKVIEQYRTCQRSKI